MDAEIRDIPLDFDGRGEVRGFAFRCCMRNGLAYMYEVVHRDSGHKHWEVFERRENRRFGVVSYPKSSSFGLWAWCCRDYNDALKRYDWVTERMFNKINM